MTRVRKINVSQVEGNSANNTDSNAIRPYGEMAVYENSDGNGPTKLELLMGDGVRNNLRSKVLSKGTFYGGDADSGDGAGLDTIKLIPDAELHRAGGDYDNDQYVIVDPTVPNHIHVRAGGTMNGSTADLFLGGEKNNVRVSDNAGRVSITAEAVLGSQTWSFDQEGNLTLPAGGDILDRNGDSVLSSGDQNTWAQTFESEDGAPADAVGIAASVEYDLDGNIIALFNHFDIDGSTYYSVGKFTSTGVKIWTARFSNEFNTDGWGLAVNGGDGDQIYVAGSTQGQGDSYERSTLTRLNAVDGTVAWSKIYDFGIESTSSVVDVASDGNPVIVGYAGESTDAYVITTKINFENGNVIWSRSLDGQGNENAYGMAVGPEGEIVVIGTMDKLGLGSTNAAETLAASPTSNVNWTLPGSVNAGGLIFNFVFDAGVVTFTVREDAVGNRTIGDQVTTILGSNIGGADGADDMIVTVASVNTAVGTTDDRMLVVRYTSTGTIDWQKAIEFDLGYDCGGADADIDSEGNIYVTGEYDRDVNGGIASALSIVKFDYAGAKLWSRRVEGGCSAFGTSIVVGPDNKLYLSGVTQPEQNGKYIWVVAKYGFDGTVEWQRLIENTTTWSFAGGNFFAQGGGSNLAVKQGYVVLSGGFGNLMDMVQPIATLVQVSATGDLFAAGDWDFKAATFTGTLNDTASDINTYPGGKTDSDNANGIDTVAVSLMTEVANFLIGTVYRVGNSDNRLVNGASELVLETSGTITLPQGGTITEGIITSNPTIQLTPATPDVASQKLVIKGGGIYNITNNSINLNYNENTAIVGDTLTFYVYSNAYADQTLYWWIYPTNAGIGDSNSGTVVLTGDYGNISILVDSDDYEFTLRVSPEADNYDPANVGVESGVINGSAPTFGIDHHLHLTTGDLTETSIFLGTDNHNVRTTTTGNIQVTTAINSGGNNVWEFDTTGTLILPNDGNIKPAGGTVNLQTTNVLSVTLTNESGIPMGLGAPVITAALGDNPGVDTIQSGWTVTGPNLTATTTVVSVVNISGDLYEITTDTTETDPFTYGSVYTVTTPVTNTWEFGTDGSVTFPDNTVQTTAYTGTTTVTRPSTTGIPDGFTLSPSNTNTNLTPGNYSNILVGFDGKNLLLGVQVDSNHNITIYGPLTASPATFIIGDSAVINGDLIGGATPADDLTITVDSLENVSIDLTKTINKLTNGEYNLADGVEGQIMYLVRQSGTTSDNVLVNVDSSDGASPLKPFRINAGFADVDNTGICTLIFTDGTWKQTGGNWD